jgi:hypothetical protein
MVLLTCGLCSGSQSRHVIPPRLEWMPCKPRLAIRARFPGPCTLPHGEYIGAMPLHTMFGVYLDAADRAEGQL